MSQSFSSSKLIISVAEGVLLIALFIFCFCLFLSFFGHSWEQITKPKYRSDAKLWCYDLHCLTSAADCILSFYCKGRNYLLSQEQDFYF